MFKRPYDPVIPILPWRYLCVHMCSCSKSQPQGNGTLSCPSTDERAMQMRCKYTVVNSSAVKEKGICIEKDSCRYLFKASSELMILLQPPKYWNYRHVPPYQWVNWCCLFCSFLFNCRSAGHGP